MPVYVGMRAIRPTVICIWKAFRRDFYLYLFYLMVRWETHPTDVPMTNKLFLTQTDTTIGFVSQNPSKIDQAKKRLPNKHYIRVVNSLETLKTFTRIPQQHKNRVRRAKGTTFIFPQGDSFRVVKGTKHNLLLDRVKWLYSSSANLSGAVYDETYAKKMTEIIVNFPNGNSGESSKIYRLGQRAIKSVR